jgi:hypothetical protein
MSMLDPESSDLWVHLFRKVLSSLDMFLKGNRVIKIVGKGIYGGIKA